LNFMKRVIHLFLILYKFYFRLLVLLLFVLFIIFSTIFLVIASKSPNTWVKTFPIFSVIDAILLSRLEIL